MIVYLRVLLGSLISALICMGCHNTVQGFGKDMENSGQEIQKAVIRDK
ncbi:MAG: hypothetical protein K0S27_507 [Gammaproteobacteria bacterium]|jgi:predicted small secreted protein|nr:hypothetical protein [Gammaproteobacteria bacterium]